MTLAINLAHAERQARAAGKALDDGGVTHGKIIEELGVEYDPRGNIRCNPDSSTSVKGVFAAGDANTGASLVVRAIFRGREAARNIDYYLKG